MYGDPDGSTSVKAIAIALPKWLFKEDMKPIIYACILFATAFILLTVGYIAQQDETTCGDGISLESKKNMSDFIAGVMVDNDSNQRL